MTQFNINIVSDTVCPWCYVGKKKLEQAITQYKERHPGSNDAFNTTWNAFYLNPDAPKIGRDKRAYYASRFGADKAAAIFERLGAVGKDVGINFNFDGKAGSTRNSHRLILLAKSKGPEIQTRVVGELMKGYFEDAQDITDTDALVKAGVRGGLEEDEVRTYLESEAGGDRVDAEARRAREEDISGVPNFTVNGQYVIGGAQDPSVFLRLFEVIKAHEK